jgi:hypothetical protein
MKILGLVDDLDIIEEILEDIGNAARVIEKVANKIGLLINQSNGAYK